MQVNPGQNISLGNLSASDVSVSIAPSAAQGAVTAPETVLFAPVEKALDGRGYPNIPTNSQPLLADDQVSLSGAAADVAPSGIDQKPVIDIEPMVIFGQGQSESPENVILSQQNTADESSINSEQVNDSSEQGESKASVGAAQEQSSEQSSQREKQAERAIELQEQRVIDQLQARDREVRQHELAHAAVGGQYAGAPSYSYQRGPDGRQYAIGGEVSIDVSPVAGDPEATIRKMQVVRAAALAPADPSAQDRRVAQIASSIIASSRADLSQSQSALASQNNEASTSIESSFISIGQNSDSQTQGSPIALAESTEFSHLQVSQPAVNLHSPQIDPLEQNISPSRIDIRT